MLIIGEDWCPDVYRGMPVMARIAEASGMEIRVFPRDSHLDIMNEFLNKGEYLSIPVAVFYTRDHQYIGHWIERPKAANQEQAQIEEQISGIYQTPTTRPPVRSSAPGTGRASQPGNRRLWSRCAR